MNDCIRTSHPVPTTTPPGPPRREHAFTLVEILIAAMLALAIISGMALAMSSSGRAISSAKITAHMNQQASQVYERMQASRGWLAHCQLPAGHVETDCTLFANGAGKLDLADVVDDDEADLKWDLTVTGHATDDASDGLSTDPKGDRDGIVPDFIEVTVALKVPASAKARFPNAQDVVLKQTFSGKGRLAKGTLIVEVCDVENQIDERMSIEACTTAGGATREADCPPGECGVFNAVKNNAASKTNPNGSVMVRRWTSPISVKITLGSTANPSDSSGSTTIVGDHLGDGTYAFRNIPAGEWTMSYPGSIGNGHVVWSTKVRPGSSTVAVQPSTTSRGLVVYRPNARGKINFNFTRTVGMINWVTDKTVQTDFPGVDFVWEYTDSCGAYANKLLGTTKASGCPSDEHTSWWRIYEDNTATMKFYRPERTEHEWGGAATNTTLSTFPEAYGRALDGLKEDHAAINVASRRGFNAPHNETLTGIVAGLNSGVHIASSKAQTVVSDPANVTGGVWVHPDSGSVNGAGTPSVKIRGTGECYVSMDSAKFYEGHVDVDKVSDLGDNGINQGILNQLKEHTDKAVTVEGFDGWRDDSCSMTRIRWNGVVYEGGVVYAYEFCYKTEYYFDIHAYERADATDTWKIDSGNTSFYKSDGTQEDCKGYNPPLACQDMAATNCGPATVYIPPRPRPKGGTSPKLPTKFIGVDAFG